MYRVTVAGSHDFGSGSIAFVVGDYAIYNGSEWEKADTTDAVSSVNGFTGNVQLALDDLDSCMDCLGTTEIADSYVLNTGDGISGNLSFTGTAANIALGSNWLSGDGADEGVFVASSGNVGVGTNNPAVPFHVAGTNLAMLFENTGTGGRQWAFFSSKDSDSIGGGKFVIYDRTLSTSVATSGRFAIDSAGRIGFGTNSPTNRIDILENANTSARVQFANPNTGTSAFASWALSNGTTQNEGLELRAHGTGYTSSGAFLQDSALVMAGSDASGGLSIVTREASAAMRFYTGGVADANERMRILSGGNVGIGTTAPNNKLEVVGGTSEASTVLAQLRSAGTGNNTGTLLRFSNSTDAASDFGAVEIAGIRTNSPGNGDAKLVLRTSTGSGLVDAITIEHDGMVGIGDTTPTSLLTVGSGDQFQVNSSGLMFTPLGASTTPSHSFVGDSNTGMWSSAADTINFSVGGTEVVEIDAATTTIANAFEAGGITIVDGIIHFPNGMCQGEYSGTTTPNVTIQACADF